jgi:hypothetical protein
LCEEKGDCVINKKELDLNKDKDNYKNSRVYPKREENIALHLYLRIRKVELRRF